MALNFEWSDIDMIINFNCFLVRDLIISVAEILFVPAYFELVYVLCDKKLSTDFTMPKI